jgi:ATP-binding protein involved in chromosome partitioning
MPPGTSDIHLTLVQEVSVTGAIVISTPQEVALADAVKGIAMFRSDKIDVPVLGLVENMSWFTPAELPENKYYIFGKEGCKKLAEKMDVPLLGQIPLVQSIREGSDNGEPVALDDSVSGNAFLALAGEVVRRVEQRNTEQAPTKKVQINT